MARRYSVPVENATLATALANALATITATAATRPAIAEFDIGSRETADKAASYLLARHITTAPAGGAAITPEKCQSDDVAAISGAQSGATGNVYETAPTLGGKLFTIGLHQRAPFRWLANPGYEFKAPAGANDGFAFVSAAITAAFVVDMVIYFEE